MQQGTIGKRIASHLNERGITKAFVAEKSGINNDSLYSYLSGRTRLSVEDFLSICEAIGTDPEVFFIQQDTPTR